MTTKPPAGMNVREVDERRERRSRWLKLGVGTLGLLIVGGAAGLGWWYLSPPAMPDDYEAAQAMVQTARFERLSAEEKKPYYDRIREQWGSLDPEKKRELRRDEAIREARDAERDDLTRRYALASEAERAVIAAEMMQQWQGRRPSRDTASTQPRERGNGEAASRERPEPTAEEQADRRQRGLDRANDHLANGNPQLQAWRWEMMRQWRGRRPGSGSGESR